MDAGFRRDNISPGHLYLSSPTDRLWERHHESAERVVVV
jgi:hypothetical protein